MELVLPSRAGTARVPDVAIHAARKKLVPPAYAEGFDALGGTPSDG